MIRTESSKGITYQYDTDQDRILLSTSDQLIWVPDIDVHIAIIKRLRDAPKTK